MDFLKFLDTHTVILDGAMGTLLQSEGLKAGQPPETLTLSRPELITDIHLRYLNAGANVISADTFGLNANRYSESEACTMTTAAIGCARAAIDKTTAKGPHYIALDIGPTGKLLRPYGDLDFEEAVAAYAPVIRAGAAAGANLVLIETMNDCYETKAAVVAAKENCTLPIIVCNVYGTDGKLMTGADVRTMACMLEGLRVNAIGANCSLGPDQLRQIIAGMLEVTSLPVVVKPNAGLPRVDESGNTVYDISPDEFAAHMADMVRLGAAAVGGCCGTTPQDRSALRAKVSSIPVSRPVTEHAPCVSSYTHTVTFGESPVIIGERLNPTGKPLLKQALREADYDYIRREAIGQYEAGADILDVNVGLPDIDENAVLARAVCEIQSVCDAPLQIDTSDSEAMGKALRRYNGKALINSVNGKQSSLDSIFPLAARYGGMLIALTLDENGIPDTAEGRFDIAMRILDRAAEYGFGKRDIIFDPLAMSVAADSNAAVTTLKTVAMLTEAGCMTSLGVSNVSYGLPMRDKINSAYFAMALNNGLCAAILNVYSSEMMTAYRVYMALSGRDADCARLISYASGADADTSPAPRAKAEASTASPTATDLYEAIIRGFKEAASQITSHLLECGVAPMDIIDNTLIPALDRVGEGYESKTLYLPQLLMSAEAAKSAFEQIRNLNSAKADSDKRGKIVLATVRGDIHDIGKNIVKLLLENYNFDVTDLGRDVPEEDVVAAAVSSDADIVGLSALMTTTVSAMENTIRLLRESGCRCKIVVGGAVLTREYAAKIGADRYAKDAMDTVKYALETINGENAPDGV